MSATLFLSPPPLSNTPHLSYNCYSNPTSYSIPISLSLNPDYLKNPKAVSSSFKPTKATSTIPSAQLTTTTSSSSNTTSTTKNSNAGSSNDTNSSVKSKQPDYSLSKETLPHASAAIRMPTAPWMKGPLLLEPKQVLDLSKPRKKMTSTNGKYRNPDRSLTDKVSGARGKKAMKTIFRGIGKLQETQDVEQTQQNSEKVGHEFSLGQFGKDGNSKSRRKMPWEKDQKIVFPKLKKEKVVTTAELSLDRVLLERLRGEAARMRSWVKVKKLGVTQAVVDQIRLIWKNNELAMLKFDLPLSRNMARATEIVEIKTEGLVVWRKKDMVVIYRGCNYQLGSKAFSKVYNRFAGAQQPSSLNISRPDNVNIFQVKSNESTVDEIMSRKEGEEEIIELNGSLYEREADRLLDGLGPRFVDWWRPTPLPVDADLLPEVVPRFKPPSRLCPPHARSKLADDELTYLRKLARPLPTHFVLGRNRKLQGLAAAIIKLWEKCHIAKIAVKWGIQNTNNEQMANELKCLTGGVLLLRNKFFIILYRGKDFLPCGVANLVAEREMELQLCQIHEEAARLKAIETFYITDEPSATTSMIGTLSEFQDIQSECVDPKNRNRDSEVQFQAENERLWKELRNQEHRLFILKMKIRRSARELAKINSAWRPAVWDEDHEMISQEERECFRKIGLKMDSSLVLGRRGVFDGVIEGVHQHWKHGEIAKVITMQRKFSQVMYTAELLQTETGGILVSVEKLKESHAIIIYRGKNYRRPLKLVPQNLLNKRQALCRSLEMQRIGSLKFFAYQRQQAISDLKCKLAELEKLGNRLNENLTGLQSMSLHSLEGKKDANI